MSEGKEIRPRKGFFAIYILLDLAKFIMGNY